MAFLLQIACTHQTRHAGLVPVCPGWLPARPARTAAFAPVGPDTAMPRTAQMKQAGNRLIRDGPALLTHGTLSQHLARIRRRTAR